MPVDFSIPLSVQPMPAINPLGVANQVQNFALARENALSLRAEREATAEKTRQQAAAEARANADEQNVRQWFSTIHPGTAVTDDQLNDLASKVGPDRAQKIAEGLDAIRQKHLKTEGDVHSMLGSVIGGIQALPTPGLRQDAYNNVTQHFTQQGLLDPSQVKPFSDDVLEEYRLQAMTPEQQATEARAKTDQLLKLKNDAAGVLGSAQNAQDYAGKLAQVDPRVAKLFPPPQAWTPQLQNSIRQMGMSGEQQVTAGQAAANAAETVRAHKVTEGETHRHNVQTELAQNPLLNVSTGPQGPAGQPGAAPAAGGSPAKGAPPAPGVNAGVLQALASQNPGIAAQIKALAEGRQQFPGGSALRAPYWQKMLDLVAQYDPTFDTVNYNARAKTRQDFTSGKSASTINALNTVAQHLDRLSTSADALNNSNWTPYNTLSNFVSRVSGQPTVTNFETDKKAVVDELTRAWRQAGGSEQDIQSWSKVLDASNSPAQLHGAIGEMGQLLEGKLSAMENQFKQGMGTAADIPIVTPQARATLTKLEQKAGKAPAAAAPTGAVPGEVSTLLKGQKDGRYTLSDGSKWIVKNGEVTGKG